MLCRNRQSRDDVGRSGRVEQHIKSAGVTVLGKKPGVNPARGGGNLACGLPDGRVYGLTDYEKDAVCVALSHYPENIAEYADFGFDLVLSGHAHGGQWRLGRRGLVSPRAGAAAEIYQGFTPRATQRWWSAAAQERGAGQDFHFPHIPVVILKSGRE